jgi:hypothetical protein
LLIEEYFQLLRQAIESCISVQSFDLIIDSKDDYQGFIRGEVNLRNGSILYCREFTNVKTAIERRMYSYQYMDAFKNLIFRYDDVKHHKKLNLPNYPHHKHDGSEDNIISSNAPTLADILNEIERLLT